MARRSQWRRAVSTFQASTGKAGGRALLAAVIGQAAVDLEKGDPAAAVYFLSNDYRGHLQWLGLPDEYLPEGVTRADLAALANGKAARCNGVKLNATFEG